MAKLSGSEEYPIYFGAKPELLIELDGAAHEDPHQKERDEERTEILKRFRIKVMRFKNEQVKANIDLVLVAILNEINKFSKRN